MLWVPFGESAANTVTGAEPSGSTGTLAYGGAAAPFGLAGYLAAASLTYPVGISNATGLTVALWVAFSNVANQQNFLGFAGANGTPSQQMILQGTCSGMCANSIYIISAAGNLGYGAPPLVGQFVHVVATYSANVYSLYYDGVLLSSSASRNVCPRPGAAWRCSRGRARPSPAVRPPPP